MAHDRALPLIAVMRHRLQTDGEGVTALVGLHGCPLRCAYCLNPACSDPAGKFVPTGFEALYERLAADDLYFQATGGGVVFGGGEPLIHGEALAEFCAYCKERKGASWRYWAETSLSVPRARMEAALPALDGFIVDIKDADAAAYRAYTGGDVSLALQNLKRLLEAKGPDAVKVRVPLIPGYNTPRMNDETEAAVRALGAARIERFVYRIAEAPPSGDEAR